MDASPRNVQVRVLEPRENTVLVVDDEAPGRDLMSSLLSTQGYRVKSACDGFAALELLEAGGIDLVLLDLMMSRMDGVEVCAQIRKGGRYPTLPVVFTTSLHDRASRIRAKEAGADDFLVKPIDGLELLVRVERLLRVRAQHEMVYGERERLAAELAKLRATSPSELVATTPTSQLEELAREHRRFIAETLRTCDFAQNDEARGRLQEILRGAEELERRAASTTTAFPLTQSRSTL